MKKIVDSARFGLFLMTFNGAYKIVLCLMRRFVTENDKYNAPVAGFLSALSLIVDVSSRRQLITVLIMSRFLDTAINYGDSKMDVNCTAYRGLLLYLLVNVCITT